MILGMDVSNYSGTPTRENVAALVNSQNIGRVIIACQFPATFQSWYTVCQELGLGIEAYIYLYNTTPYAAQVIDAENAIAGSGIDRLWLDIEDDTSPVDLASELAAIAQAGVQTPLGIYTSAGYWTAHGNPQAGSHYPLWNASWNDGASFDLNLVAPYGGWLRARCKQYAAGYQSYGLSVDLDVWDF